MVASRRSQSAALAQSGIASKKKLVVFFVPGIERVTGGALQIFTLHRLTREYFSATDTDALICWVPGTGWHMHKFDGFRNDVIVFPLEMVLSSINDSCGLLFHLPEYACSDFCERFGWEQLTQLRDRHGLKINILNQNIEQMPGRDFVERLKSLFPSLTCTVGNPAWATENERKRLNIPLHILPTWYYPDDAPWQPYETKSDLMIVSPDQNSNRELVMTEIRNSFPNLSIIIIRGLKYENYLELERRAKWSLTFGEGLDGYFYGPILRGGVAFAVRNGTFDLSGFEDLRTIYPDYESMAARIAKDMLILSNKTAYESYNKSVRAPLAVILGPERTSNAMQSFYQGRYSLP